MFWGGCGYCIQCIISTPINFNSWKQTSIFHTFILCNSCLCKLVIDRGSTMNVISRSVMAKFSLRTEQHPWPFNVAWVDRTSLLVIHRCLVPLTLGPFFGGHLLSLTSFWVILGFMIMMLSISGMITGMNFSNTTKLSVSYWPNPHTFQRKLLPFPHPRVLRPPIFNFVSSRFWT